MSCRRASRTSSTSSLTSSCLLLTTQHCQWVSAGQGQGGRGHCTLAYHCLCRHPLCEVSGSLVGRPPLPQLGEALPWQLADSHRHPAACQAVFGHQYVVRLALLARLHVQHQPHLWSLRRLNICYSLLLLRLCLDPLAAWIDAGLAEVRPDVSNPAYGASHTFVEDWRTHRVWDWLSREHWSLIPTDERLLDVQVGSMSGCWGATLAAAVHHNMPLFSCCLLTASLLNLQTPAATSMQSLPAHAWLLYLASTSVASLSCLLCCMYLPPPPSLPEPHTHASTLTAATGSPRGAPEGVRPSDAQGNQAESPLPALLFRRRRCG